jgi:hypothetical protein
MTVPSPIGVRGRGRRLPGWPLLLCLGLAACGADGRYVVIGSAAAPSASGIVEVDDIGGGNTQVAVHVEHLHPPARLKDGYGHFVVWFVPGAGAPVRAGALRYDSEARTGDLTETSPFREFEVRITAEKDSRPAAPSEVVVATQAVAID